MMDSAIRLLIPRIDSRLFIMVSKEGEEGVYCSLAELVNLQFKARDFSFLPGQPVSSILAGRYASRLRGRGLNFEELRRYRSGDDIRTMDWRVTARTRKPHVRVYTEEKDRSVVVVVDQRMNMFFGTRKKLKSVSAAEVAALSVWRTLAVGDRVGAVIFNDEHIEVIRPHRSRKHCMQILAAILKMNRALSADSAVPANPGQLNRALHRASEMVPHDGLVVTISDFSGTDEQTRQIATHLAAHCDILGILTVDPYRQKPQPVSIHVTDGDQELELDLRRRKLRQAIAEDYTAEHDRISHFLRGLSAPLLVVNNDGDTVEQIRTLLGVRGR